MRSLEEIKRTNGTTGAEAQKASKPIAGVVEKTPREKWDEELTKKAHFPRQVGQLSGRLFPVYYEAPLIVVDDPNI